MDWSKGIFEDVVQGFKKQIKIKKDPRSIFEGFFKDFSKIFEDSFKI